MARATFERVKPLLLAHEGGYTAHKKDPGNWSGGKAGVGVLIGTNHGIAAATLIGWRGRMVTADEMRALSVDEAVEIYKVQYWDSVKGDALPAGVDYCVYDYSVNSGPSWSAKELQRVVGAKVDGFIGVQTLRAIKECGKTSIQIVDEICDRRLAFMRGLRHWRKFGKGWSKRVSDVRLKSRSFAANAPIPDVPVSSVPTPRAKPDDTSVTTALKKPETWLPFFGGGSGVLSLFTEPGPMQWALAIGLVVGVGVGAYYVVKRIQRDAD